MKTCLSPEQITAKYEKARFYYYALIPICLIPFGILCFLSLFVPSTPTFIKILLLLIVLGIFFARYFVARCPVCGYFLFFWPFKTLLHTKCPYCKTDLSTGEVSEKNADKIAD